MIAEPASASLALRRLRSGVTLLGWVAGVAAAIPLVLYVWIALHRMGYPYELDWMEGGSVELAGTVLGGHSLYAAPTLQFVGWTYTPLYYLVCAAVAKVTGLGFLPLRLVSFASSLAVCWLLWRLVVRETGDRVAGLVAAGLFAATYRISGTWLDIDRVDSLFLALTLLTVLVGRSARTVRSGLVLGAVAFLAFFTKQSALIALLPPLACVAIRRPRAGGPALALLGVLVVGSTEFLNAVTHGWYTYYVVDELAGQPWIRQLWVGFWRDDVLAQLWPEAAVGALAMLAEAGTILLRWRRRRGETATRAAASAALRSPLLYQAATAAGLLGASWFSRLHSGGYLNVLMPAYAACALLAGLAWARLQARGRLLGALATATVPAQVALLAYPVSAVQPTRADRVAGAELMAALRALPGPVLVIRHPWYGTLAGKGSFAQSEGMTDILRSQAPRGARALRASLASGLDRYHIKAVVLDGSYDAPLLGPELQHQFRLASRSITRVPLYAPTDTQSAPTLFYVRDGQPTAAPTQSSSDRGRPKWKPCTTSIPVSRISSSISSSVTTPRPSTAACRARSRRHPRPAA